MDNVFWAIGGIFCIVGGVSLLVIVSWWLLEMALSRLQLTKIIMQWYAEKLKRERDERQ